MIYAVGDIHGQLTMLEDALAWIEQDGGPSAQIVFMGDYTDRGPNSRGVLDVLIKGRDAGRNWTFLKGNHDRMFTWFLEPIARHDPQLFLEYTWYHERLGGQRTLESYGVHFKGRRRFGDVHGDARRLVPQAHIDFLNDTVLTFETDEFFFVHAGVRPGVAFKDQVENDLLWIRQGFVDHNGTYQKWIVHGHTALDHPTRYINRTNTDGGAGYGRPLYPVVFDGSDSWMLTGSGRQALPDG
ncbi:MAG: metallophosphoesterase [Pseudomonadota bacterium]